MRAKARAAACHRNDELHFLMVILGEICMGGGYANGLPLNVVT